MTISPQPPRLKPTGTPYRELVENHLTFVKVGFGYYLEVLIKAGYVTDGASVPRKIFPDGQYSEEIKETIQKNYPKISTRWDLENFINYLIGTPWDMPRLLAAIVHDVLYGRKWGIRWLCDRIYKWILIQNGYESKRAEIEYLCIRLVGWNNWNSITKEEEDYTKKLSVVKFIRKSKIAKEIENFSPQKK